MTFHDQPRCTPPLSTRKCAFSVRCQRLSHTLSCQWCCIPPSGRFKRDLTPYFTIQHASLTSGQAVLSSETVLLPNLPHTVLPHFISSSLPTPRKTAGSLCYSKRNRERRCYQCSRQRAMHCSPSSQPSTCTSHFRHVVVAPGMPQLLDSVSFSLYHYAFPHVPPFYSLGSRSKERTGAIWVPVSDTLGLHEIPRLIPSACIEISWLLQSPLVLGILEKTFIASRS